MSDLYTFILASSPGLEWGLVVSILFLAVLIISRRIHAMFQAIQEQITRLASVVNNLAVHIATLTQERDALKAQLADLQQAQQGLADVEKALQDQVDIAAALFPQG